MTYKIANMLEPFAPDDCDLFKPLENIQLGHLAVLALVTTARAGENVVTWGLAPKYYTEN